MAATATAINYADRHGNTAQMRRGGQAWRSGAGVRRSLRRPCPRIRNCKLPCDIAEMQGLCRNSRPILMWLALQTKPAYHLNNK